MFVPSCESLLNALNVDKFALDGNGQINVPARFLKLLVQVALAASEFDEERYLRENPDVAKAVGRGELESAHMHYIGFGYFEGRLGGGSAVDSDWYLSKYPDVATAVKDGRVKSAEAHFHSIGGGEGRCPAPDYEADAGQWESAIRGA
ncbi:hypothetical protein [Bradyrhizobium sp. 62]|uniref:hypothetical protein n=1 Tax=Bradyrhizobium sp. 62 TaxID=1043588 RepID=UPI001FF7DC66|nr:hypothetical protein [Bradyrhizobium sp. 62]MCK1368310.1 hypothetical protein [Bradyrhizobium sp. 62]